jgi:4'-phosphopantetheinyl transferase
MPLVKLNITASGKILGVYKIMESIAELSAQVDMVIENAEAYGQITHPERQKEWLAARYLAKLVCEKASHPYRGLRKEPTGKPYMEGYGSEISITHSFPWVAVILSETEPVGIDLEQPKLKLLKVGPRFLNDREWAHAANDPLKLCLYWCAKETLYKIRSEKGLLFKEGLEVDPFEVAEEGILMGRALTQQGWVTYQMRYEKVNGGNYLVYND